MKPLRVGFSGGSFREDCPQEKRGYPGLLIVEIIPVMEP